MFTWWSTCPVLDGQWSWFLQFNNRIGIGFLVVFHLEGPVIRSIGEVNILA